MPSITPADADKIRRAIAAVKSGSRAYQTAGSLEKQRTAAVAWARIISQYQATILEAAQLLGVESLPFQRWRAYLATAAQQPQQDDFEWAAHRVEAYGFLNALLEKAVDSCIFLHPARAPGEWSLPMSKTEMATRLRLKPRAFATFAKAHGLKRCNRQLWQICFDGMDAKTRRRIETGRDDTERTT